MKITHLAAALAGAFLAADAAVAVEPARSCHMSVEADGGTLQNKAVNYLDQIHALRLAIRFVNSSEKLLPHDQLDISLDRDYPLITISCIVTSMDRLVCVALPTGRLRVDLQDNVVYSADRLEEPLKLSLSWTSDGSVTLEGPGRPPRTFHVASKPTHLSVKNPQGCDVEYGGSAPAQ